MADEPEKPGGEPEADGSAEAENERPTVSPPFDPVAFARDILKPSPAPMPAVRPRYSDPHTIATPAHGTSSPTPIPWSVTRTPAAGTPLDRPRTPPGLGARPGAHQRKKTPTSTLSLANAHVPSNLPPPPDRQTRRASEPKKHESLSSMNPVDREWADLEIATRPPPPLRAPKIPGGFSTQPPPADGPEEDPVIEIGQDRTPQLDLDDIDLGEGANRSGEAPESSSPKDAKPRPLDGASPHSPPRFEDSLREPSPGSAARGPQRRGIPTLESMADDDPEDEHAAQTVRRPVPTEFEFAKPREREMADRVSLGDYSGALEIAEQILADKANDPEARACAENCRTVLRQMYATRLGPLDRVPVVMVPRDQLRWLSIDHKAGFVLSLVDGVSTLEMIIDVSGMAELDTLRILSELAQQRIISLR